MFRDARALAFPLDATRGRPAAPARSPAGGRRSTAIAIRARAREPRRGGGARPAGRAAQVPARRARAPSGPRSRGRAAAARRPAAQATGRAASPARGRWWGRGRAAARPQCRGRPGRNGFQPLAGSVAAALALGLAGWCPSASEHAGRRRRGGLGSHGGLLSARARYAPFPPMANMCSWESPGRHTRASASRSWPATRCWSPLPRWSSGAYRSPCGPSRADRAPRHGAARALAELAEGYGHDDVAQILDEWLDDRPGAT